MFPVKQNESGSGRRIVPGAVWVFAAAERRAVRFPVFSAENSGGKDCKTLCFALYSKGEKKGDGDMEKDTAAVIVAAGSASRMGRNKQLLQIGGVPVLARTLTAFQRCEDIAEIIVVARPQDVGEFTRLAQAYGIGKLKAVVEGGADRRESVANGLAAVTPSLPLLAVHDGARPFILPALVSRCIADAREFGASALAVRVKDTIKVVQDGFIASTPDRENLWQCQTPQGFYQESYRSACKTAGDPRNLKITTPEDLTVAQAIAEETEFRMEELHENRTRI
mgnify:CR=1 FL=1